MKTTFTSPNIPGKKWVTRLEKGGYIISSYAKETLKKITPTKNTYDIVILKMDKEYFTIQEVRDEAKRRGYITPPSELAPMLREEISDKDIETIGLTWLIVMHEAITDSDGDPLLLGLNRFDARRWLYAYVDRPGGRWYREYGFVFLAPQGTGDSDSPNSYGTLASESSAELSSEASLESRIASLEKWRQAVISAVMKN